LESTDILNLIEKVKKYEMLTTEYQPKE
jgi:hypothetical protein